jgi:hypothetical protein
MGQSVQLERLVHRIGRSEAAEVKGFRDCLRYALGKIGDLHVPYSSKSRGIIVQGINISATCPTISIPQLHCFDSTHCTPLLPQYILNLSLTPSTAWGKERNTVPWVSDGNFSSLSYPLL